ncbi:MAG: EscU/YscU/HrcU family type III secretion system export apparatus switch protein [Planctomycetota bacterium]
MSDTADRKHLPTPMRRKKALEQGQFARSQDLAVALGMLTAAALLWMFGPTLLRGLRGILSDSLSLNPANFKDSSNLLDAFQDCVLKALWIVVPLLGGILLFSAVQSWIQNRFRLSTSNLKLDLTRLNPSHRIRQLFGSQNAMQLAFSVLKAAAIFGIVGYRLHQGGLLPMASSLAAVDGVEQAAGEVGYALVGIAFEVGCVLLLLGCADYAMQWYRTEQSLKMTDEELREELKESSTDPALVRKRREMQAKMAD